MGTPDPSAGRLALAPTDPGLRPRADRGGRRPERPEPPRREASVGRRRLVVVTVLLTVAALAYLALTSLGGGGGRGGAGTASGDAYQQANRSVATQARAIVRAGTDLRALRNVDQFRAAVERSLAAISAQIGALQRLAASRHGAARTTIDETVASAQRLALLGTAFERDLGKLELGAANRDQASIDAELANLEQQATAWKHR